MGLAVKGWIFLCLHYLVKGSSSGEQETPQLVLTKYKLTIKTRTETLDTQSVIPNQTKNITLSFDACKVISSTEWEKNYASHDKYLCVLTQNPGVLKEEIYALDGVMFGG